MDTFSIKRLTITWLETKLKEWKIAWGVFVLLLCAFLFAIEISYSLRPDVNKLVGVAIYDVIIEGYALTTWAITRGSLTQSLKAIRPLIRSATDYLRT